VGNAFEVSFWSHLLNVIIVGLGLLLVLTILIQRGKGGGLIGAFGGAGGSSPFGSKAGDTFTRITITMAGIWVLLIMIHVKVAKLDLEKNTARGQQGQTQSEQG
jgi:preprotein translocase subunit SecG